MVCCTQIDAKLSGSVIACVLAFNAESKNHARRQLH
jgi:hypothetical protein